MAKLTDQQLRIWAIEQASHHGANEINKRARQLLRFVNGSEIDIPEDLGLDPGENVTLDIRLTGDPKEDAKRQKLAKFIDSRLPEAWIVQAIDGAVDWDAEDERLASGRGG